MELDGYESPCDEDCLADTSKVNLLLQFGFEIESEHADSAMKMYVQAQKLANKIKAGEHESKAWSYLGLAKLATGVYDEALEYHWKALSIRDSLGLKRLVAYSLNNIGVVHFYTGNFIDAEDAYREALVIYEGMDDKQGVSASYTNIGLVNRYQQEFDSAIFYYEKSIAIDRELNDSGGIAIGYNNLGNSAKDKGDYATAQEYFKQGLQIFKDQGNDNSAAVVLGNIASCYVLEGKYEEALEIGLEGLDLARKAGSVTTLKDNYQHVSASLEALGRHKEALTSYKSFVQMRDSLLNITRYAQIDELNIKYDAERQEKIAAMTKLELSKERETRNLLMWIASVAVLVLLIAIYVIRSKRRNHRILQGKNEDIIRQKLELGKSLEEVQHLNTELERSNRAKDKFFSILAHDLKGPILSIKQAINMVHTHFDSFSEDEIKQYLNKLKGSSERANNLLVDLLDWSLSQKGLISFTPEDQDITDMVDQNVQLKKAIAEQKQINLIWEKPEAISVRCDFGMINTVIRNLISNALKFTPPGGDINVKIERFNDRVQVHIKDSGIGMDEEKLNTLFKIDEARSEKGTEGEAGTGLGLILCKEFIEMHEGSICVDSKPDAGTEFFFVLPLN